MDVYLAGVWGGSLSTIMIVTSKKGIPMHSQAGLKITIAALTILAAVSAFGADSTLSIHLYAPLMLNGKQIAAGEYNVTWAGQPDSLQVKILAGRKEVASSAARMVESPYVTQKTAVVAEGGKLKEIHFGNKNTTLLFTDQAASTPPGSEGK